jgi:hypothetical protein
MMKLENTFSDPSPQDWSGFAEQGGQQDYLGGSYENDPGMSYQFGSDQQAAMDFWRNAMNNPNGGGGGFGWTPNKIDVNAIMDPTYKKMQTSQGDQWKNNFEKMSKTGQTGSMFDWQQAEDARRMNEDWGAMLAPMVYGEEDKYRTMQMQAAAEAASGQRAAYQNQLAAAAALFGGGQQGFDNTMALSQLMGSQGTNQFNMENTLANQYNNPAWMDQANNALRTGGSNSGMTTYAPNFWDNASSAAGQFVNSDWGNSLLFGGKSNVGTTPLPGASSGVGAGSGIDWSKVLGGAAGSMGGDAWGVAGNNGYEDPYWPR